MTIETTMETYTLPELYNRRVTLEQRYRSQDVKNWTVAGMGLGSAIVSFASIIRSGEFVHSSTETATLTATFILSDQPVSTTLYAGLALGTLMFMVGTFKSLINGKQYADRRERINRTIINTGILENTLQTGEQQ